MANPIEENDALAQALGRLAGRWGMAEFTVEVIFSMLLDADMRRAALIFSFFKTVSTQVDVLELLFDEEKRLTDDERSSCKSVLRKFRNMAAQRNSLIHYPFGYNQSEGLYKLRYRRRGDSLHWAEPTSPEQVMAFADEVSALNVELLRAETKVRDAWLKMRPRPPLPPAPSIPILPTPGQSQQQEP